MSPIVFVLIVTYQGHGIAALAAEFSSKAACQLAQEALQRKLRHVEAVCIPVERTQ